MYVRPAVACSERSLLSCGPAANTRVASYRKLLRRCFATAWPRAVCRIGWREISGSNPTKNGPRVVPCVRCRRLPATTPWHDWEEVRRLREDLWLHRTSFLHRGENLTTEERQRLSDLLGLSVVSFVWLAPS